MAEITQTDRLLKVSTVLPDDTLLIDSFWGQEGISQPFRLSVMLLADVQTNQDQQVDPNKLVGSSLTIDIELNGGGKRPLNGLIRSFTKQGRRDRFAVYRAEVVPWFSFLSLRTNCRIFQNKTVPDIISEVVKENGFAGVFRSDLTKSYTEWDYCVQYRESDFAFLSRLMEAEGIAYYFEHGDNKHTLVMADAPAAYKACPGQSTFLFDPEAGTGDFEDTINAWATEQQLLSGKWTARDFHLEMPDNTLQASEDSVFANDVNRGLEKYDYPGDYGKKFNAPEKRLGSVRPEGDKLVRIYMEGDEARHVVIEGAGHGRAMASGHTVTVDARGTSGIDGNWLVVAMSHSALQHPDYLTEGRIGEGYANTFNVIEASVQFNPLRTTPKPVVYGPQTAVVVDENPTPSEEIWPDKYGRVRVRFRWDRENKSACWVRVGQAWAGQAWGYHWIPRIGDEVIVTFLEGDPDCPLIVGSVYNHNNMPPFALPDNKTQSGIMTRSSPHGGSQDFNMLRFEDKAGGEEIYVQAQKSLNTLVKQCESRTVGASRSTTIEQDDTRSVEKGNDSLTVKKGDRTVTIQTGNRSVEVSQGNDSLKVTLGGISQEAPAGTHKTTAMQIELDGTAGIKLTCGASSIEMNPAMITITSPMVKINC